jgi:hypothetical protein
MIRGCLERPCEPSEPLPRRARHAIGHPPGEAPQHEPAHGQGDHGFTALQEVFVLSAEAALTPDPGDRAFDHPPARALPDLQGPAARLCPPRAEPLPAVGRGRPDVLPPRAGLAGGCREPGGHVGIPQVRGMDEDTHRETRVNHRP